MTARSFFDTPILLYTDDWDDGDRQEAALGLVESTLRRGQGVSSNQVLQEYFSAATGRYGLPSGLARRKVELFARLELVELGPQDTLIAIDLQERHDLSLWDALVVRAAVKGECATLYSTTLEAGLQVGPVTVVDPFV